MVVNGVGYLGSAETVRFGAFGNLTLVAAAMIVHLHLILTHLRLPTDPESVTWRVRRVLSLLISVNEYRSVLCMMI